jgi:hypothetical protein
MTWGFYHTDCVCWTCVAHRAAETGKAHSALRPRLANRPCPFLIYISVYVGICTYLRITLVYQVSRKDGVLRFSISASLSRTLLPVSIDVESDSCGICVVSPHLQSLHLSVYLGVYFPKEKKLN